MVKHETALISVATDHSRVYVSNTIFSTNVLCAGPFPQGLVDAPNPFSLREFCKKKSWYAANVQRNG